jgi:hypothetical protein
VTRRLRHCVECPSCHTRYIIGFSPYGNGSYLVANSEDAELHMLFCSCSTERGSHPFKMSALKMYFVTHEAHERGYGSPDEIVLVDGEKRQAS